MKTRRIAILGGGTAGWMAANHLGVELSADREVEITVIESDEVPTIGVGEGTVPAIKTSLRKFGISEASLLLACDTTFKSGIKFENWLDARKHGVGNFYYHPFSSPYPSGLDITPYLLEVQAGHAFQEVSSSARVSEAQRCPKAISSPPYQGEIEYAYHVDARKFAELLARNAIAKYRVRHQIATVVAADRNGAGDIASLRFKNGETAAYDFYVDCSGFAGVLTHRTLQVPFVDKSHQILTDSALVQQVPSGEHDEIPPYTLATAHAAGWIWDIPVAQRRGTGFVYSSRHMDEAQAMEAYRAYLNLPEARFAPRKIPMKIGYRQQFWTANCAALGLAQGFVEPLEATSILLTDFSAGLLARNFPRMQGDAARLSPYCNEVVAYTCERIIDFIQLHYHLSDRSDSDFWRDNRSAAHLSDTLRERLDRWRLGHPRKSDFFSRFDLFDVDNYLYVLYGMKYPTRPIAISDFERSESRAELERVAHRSGRLIDSLPGHREWIAGFREAVARG